MGIFVALFQGPGFGACQERTGNERLGTLRGPKLNAWDRLGPLKGTRNRAEPRGSGGSIGLCGWVFFFSEGKDRPVRKG